MKAEALAEADSRRKNQCSRKGKRQGTVVDLPFVPSFARRKRNRNMMAAPAPATARTSRNMREGGILPARLTAIRERIAAR